MWTPLAAMIRKDLKLFFSDRRSVIVGFVVPIAIASFFGSVFSGANNGQERARVSVMIVDQDGSKISQGIAASAATDRNLKIQAADEAAARDAVQRGTVSVAVVIPHGFGDASGSAFFSGGDKPQLGMLYDPSKSTELAMVRGVFTEHVMQAVSREMFNGEQGRAYVENALPQIEKLDMDAAQKTALLQMLRSVQHFYNQPVANGQPGNRAPGLTLPYTVSEQAVTSGPADAYNGYAHSFNGMGIQFLLFAMANLGIEMLLERQRGLWKRLRAAPVSRVTLLLGKGLSGALISLMILGVSFVFAMIVFHVRINGSVAGFIGVAIACSLMASTFGILVAALGNSPGTARGVTSLAVLMLVMLGGAWVPTFIFPAWLQRVTLVVPVRWAVDGLDAMSWRGLGLPAAVAPILVLLAFAVLFAGVAMSRFKWEEGT